MKKLFMALALVIATTACNKMEEFESASNFVLTGYNESNADSRTAFGTPNESTIPFLWSSGDYIWLGQTSSDAINADCQIANFTFSGGSPAYSVTGHVFYNLTGNSEYAKVLNIQTADGNLGNDGDFGYATLDKYNSFCLKHKTSYIWFDTTTDDADMPKLTSIKLDADDVNIAGKQTYDFNNDCWSSSVTEGSSTITLNFAEGHTLVAENEGVMAAMVCLPATISGKTLTITYTFEGGSTFTETKTPTKDLAVGATTRIKTEIAKNQLVKEPSYELRVLTFEDGTEGFEPYECEFFYAMNYTGENKMIEKWSDYIPRDGQYGNGHGAYEWYDEGNTELAFVKPEIESWWGISGHAGISDYVGTDEDIAKFGDDNMMFMIDLQAYNVTGGANGSKNFCSQYGYLDPEEYATQYSPEGILPGIQFKDEEPRVIDHMYVTNTTYAYGIITRGECDFGGSYEYTDESTFKIIAYGYDSFEDTEPTTTEFYLLNTGKRIVTDWTKWDLSVLGKVVRVEFNLVACYEGYGRYGLVIPAYFAYDDVAVRFEK
jgi:hypothetical protein